MEVEAGSIIIALSTYPKENPANQFISNFEEGIKNYKRGRAKNFLDIANGEADNLDEDDFNHAPIIKEYISEGDEFIPEYQKKENFHIYHNCLKYHIFGKYDIAFISLTENFALSNKVFLPTTNDGDYKPGHLKTHVLSGIPIKSKYNTSENKFKQLLGYEKGFDLRKVTFTCISNLKLNNSFLLGNGVLFIDLVIKKIEDILNKDVLYQMVKSFSSSEISLILFSSDIDIIKEKVLEIRGMMFIKLVEDVGPELRSKIINNSILTKNEKLSENTNTINYSHIFADTQSFFGIRLTSDNDWIIKEKEGFKSHIEWEIRPGHEKFIKKYFNGNNITLSSTKCNFIPGKTDFFFSPKRINDNLSLNYAIYNLLRLESVGEDPISNHVRSIKTKIVFKTGLCKKDKSKETGRTKGNKEFINLFVSELSAIKEIAKQLKILKIPSELRNRLLKVFYNFESAIQNPLVNNLFLDLSFFVENLKNEISNWSNEILDYYDGEEAPKVKRVHNLEKILSDYIDHFEDAFNIRYINNYSFDEVSDFMISYNSPLQQLITSFDNYFKSLCSILAVDELARIVITRVNELSTTSTSSSVNFAIYNLYEPGILFYSATKEIFTVFFKNDKNNGLEEPINIGYKKFCKQFFTHNSASFAFRHRKDLVKHDPLYYLIDYCRYNIFFKNNFKSYLFWHYAYLIQLPAIYNTIGDINKDHLIMEFCRLLFLAIVLDLEEKQKTLDDNNAGEIGPNERFFIENCPKPDMLNVWNHLYNELRDFIYTLIIQNDSNFSFRKWKDSEDNKGGTFNFLKYLSIALELVTQEFNSHSSQKTKDIKKQNFNAYESFEIEEIDLSTILQPNTGKIDIEWLVSSFEKEKYKNAMFSLTKRYLETIYKTTNTDPTKFIIPYLNRDWRNGNATIPKTNIDAYFLFDPTGGAFFHAFEKSKKFSLIRNKVFVVLMHHSSLLKESLYNDWKIKSNHEHKEEKTKNTMVK